MNELYFVEIHGESAGFQLRIHQGDSDKPLVTAPLDLARTTRVGDRSATLKEISRDLLEAKTEFLKAFHERPQLEIGQLLYGQTFGRLDRAFPSEADVRVHVVTDDEHVARLPWALLARSGHFLSASGWSIALSRPGRAPRPCLLPPSPKLLVAAPRPGGATETYAESHLEELELLLSGADRHFERGKHLRVVTTWEAFRREVDELQPDVLYFYGHGMGNTETTRLAFAQGKANKLLDVPVADVAQCLRRSCEKPPALAYVNCCRGDAGGLLGAGWQLGDVVPAVVTNRTIAFIDAAQRQAIHFWKAVLLDGQPPHRALAEMYGHLGDMDLSFRDSRWMTPVLHCHYDHWESHPSKPRHRLDDPHWSVKLDRVQQFGQVVMQTQKMLFQHRPPCMAYLWYGQEGQGVDLFHQRLKVELRDFLRENHLYEVRPRWPDDLANSYRSFEDMMLEAFEVGSLDAIPARVRHETRGESGRDTVVYVRHEPLRYGDVVRPEHLKLYLEWWDDEFAPIVRESPAFGLLGVSFIVSHPPRFLKVLRKRRIDDPELRRVVFHVLDELEKLTRKDLLDFLHTHNVVLPRDHKDRILDEILEKTGGHYEMTLEALRDLVHRAWDEREATEEPEESGVITW